MLKVTLTFTISVVNKLKTMLSIFQAQSLEGVLLYARNSTRISHVCFSIYRMSETRRPVLRRVSVYFFLARLFLRIDDALGKETRTRAEDGSGREIKEIVDGA